MYWIVEVWNKANSINKVSFVKGVGNKDHGLQLQFFSKEINSDWSFCVLNCWSMKQG